jgi:putative ubiquitin-RnfH superfamily antitoxin RatB of RatAB toxin-antitoxin module
MPSSSLPISALPEIADRIDGAERALKADIARMKKLLANRAATLPPSIAEASLQQAKDALDLLAVHSRQLTRWQKDAITDAERVEVVRLRAIIPDIRPLVQRSIALATELDKRAKTGTVSPAKKWRHWAWSRA